MEKNSVDSMVEFIKKIENRDEFAKFQKGKKRKYKLFVKKKIIYLSFLFSSSNETSNGRCK